MPGLAIAVSGRAGFTAPQYAEHAIDAERNGFTHIFATETATDPLTYAVWMASATSSIVVGTAITNISIRPPAAMAMAVAAAADASADRFVLGVGTGNPEMNSQLAEVPSGSTLTRVEEYLGVLRQSFEGPVQHDGEIYRVRGLDLTRRPHRSVPVWVAALQAGMLRLAGGCGDGAILHLRSAEAARRGVDIVRGAAREAGRDPADVLVSCMVPVCLDADPEQALEAARQTVLRYALHPIARRIFDDAGYSDDLSRITELMDAGDQAGARRAVGPDLARSFVVHGSPDRCSEQIQAYVDAGVDLPILFPMPAADGHWDDCIRRATTQLGPTATRSTR